MPQIRESGRVPYRGGHWVPALTLRIILVTSTLVGCSEPATEVAEPAILRDATRKSAIDFVHFNGVSGEFYLPEITGSGGALFDYDNDGDLDLYLVQGARLTKGNRQGKIVPGDRLYRNDLQSADGAGELHFTDVTEASGIKAFGYGMGVATGDYDNDGWVDLYVTNLGSNQMLRNNGNGTFADVTGETGTDDPRWSTSATFFDFDGDGWLDLYVTNYVDFSIDKKVECFAYSSARDYCGPDAYHPVGDRLFRNQADGRFQDVTARAGISQALGAGLGVVATDLNGDGWTDIYVANDGDPNRLWTNQQGRGFVDEALLAGVALNHAGQAEASMGVAVADVDGDGDEDLFITHLDGESNTLYLNLGNGFFEDRTIPFGLHAPSLPFTGFGTSFFDYDNDGWLDLLVLNGAVRLLEDRVREGEPYPLQQTNQLFHNRRGASFEEVTHIAGPTFRVPEVSRGAAFGDVDNDGDTDVVLFNNNGRARLLLNEASNCRHWLGLRLLGNGTHRDTTQARVEVLAPGGTSLWRRGHSDGSYCSASDSRILVGMGDDDRPRTVRVHWSPSVVEQWRALTVDRYWTLQKGHRTPGK